MKQLFIRLNSWKYTTNDISGYTTVCSNKREEIFLLCMLAQQQLESSSGPAAPAFSPHRLAVSNPADWQMKKRYSITVSPTNTLHLSWF